MLIAKLAAVAVMACAVLAVSSPFLRRLLSPAGARDAFADIATSRFALGAASICAAAGLVAVSAIRWPAWLPWLGFAAWSVWLTCVDAVTGLLPRPMTA